MIASPAETTLAVVIWLFFLYDAVMLVYSNELLFVRSPAGWRAVRPKGLEVLGKTLYLPSPLMLWQPAIRLAWPLDEGNAAVIDYARQDRHARAMLALRLPVIVLAGLILVYLPLALVTVETGPLVWSGLAMAYLAVLTLLLMVYRLRRQIGLTAKGMLGLAIELLLCPPYAINVVRRLTLKWPAPFDALQFARWSGDDDSLRLLERCIAEHRLEMETLAGEGGTPPAAPAEEATHD